MSAVKEILDGSQRIYSAFQNKNEFALMDVLFEEEFETKVLFACRINGEQTKNHCAREKSKMRSVFQSWSGSGVKVEQLVAILVEIGNEQIAVKCGLQTLYKAAQVFHSSRQILVSPPPQPSK